MKEIIKEIELIGINHAQCAYSAPDGSTSIEITKAPRLSQGSSEDSVQPFARPKVLIEFGLQRSGSLEFTSKFEIPACLGATTTASSGASATHPATSVKAANAEAAAKAIASHFDLACKQQIENKGQLHQPFMLRYALRMADGSTIAPSAPILMLPTVLPPILNAQSAPTDDADIHVLTLSTSTYGYFQLRYRIIQGLVEEWQNKIAGIDIYITPPIPTFQLDDTSSAGVKSYAECLSHSLVGLDDNRGRPSEDDTDDDADEEANIFMGRYSLGLDLYSDHYLSVADARSMRVWGVSQKHSLADAIKSQGKFYHVATISSDCLEMDHFEDLVIDCTSAESIVAKPMLEDNALMPLLPQPLGAATVGNCVCYYGGSDIPPQSMSMRTALGGATNLPPAPCRVTVLLKSGDSVVAATCEDANAIDLTDDFPRYFYYPHSGAYCAVIQQGTQIWTLPLKPHPSLPGSHWLGSLESYPEANADVAIPSLDGLPTSIPTSNLLRFAKNGNPLAISHVTTVGSGSIIAVKTALKSMAQGTFGQYPAYAFCTDGVWACSVDSAVSPTLLNHDCAYSAAAIAECNEGIAYACRHGIMLLKGAQREILSDNMMGKATEASLLPGFDFLAEYAQISLPIPSLADILPDCALRFHPCERILEINGETSYAYSLDRKKWMQWTSQGGTLILTRPIKVDAPVVGKRFAKIALTGHAPADCGIATWASDDMRNWTLLGSAIASALSLPTKNKHKYIIVGAAAPKNLAVHLHSITLFYAK